MSNQDFEWTVENTMSEDEAFLNKAQADWHEFWEEEKPKFEAQLRAAKLEEGNSFLLWDDFTEREKHIIYLYWRFRKDNLGDSPSMKQIAEKLGISRNGVYSLLYNMCAKGHITLSKKGKKLLVITRQRGSKLPKSVVEGQKAAIAKEEEKLRRETEEAEREILGAPIKKELSYNVPIPPLVIKAIPKDHLPPSQRAEWDNINIAEDEDVG